MPTSEDIVAGTAPSPRTGLLTALRTAAVVRLGLWGLAGFGVLVGTGVPTDWQPLAGGAVVIPAWTYPTFLLFGAVAFGRPARHAARQSPAPRRWVLAGGLIGPPLVITVVAGTAQLLVTAGLLPRL